MMIKPTVVLSVITAIVSALLITAHNLTYVDTSGVITEKLMEKCVQLMGEGDYSIVTDREKPEGVYKIIQKENGLIAFEVIADGYNKGGLDLLISMNADGSVSGIAIVSLTETPGLGTNVADESFLSEFAGASSQVVIVKKTPSAQGEIEAVSGATYSSKGVAKAVNIAVKAYNEWSATV